MTLVDALEPVDICSLHDSDLTRMPERPLTTTREEYIGHLHGHNVRRVFPRHTMNLISDRTVQVHRDIIPQAYAYDIFHKLKKLSVVFLEAWTS